MTSIWKNWTSTQLRQASPTALALVGDAVYAVMVRELLLEAYPLAKADFLSARAARLCSAVFQDQLSLALQESLNEDELYTFRRCHNAHSGTKAKNCTYEQYRNATALEGLFGWLYLGGQFERLSALMHSLSIPV